MQKIWRSTLLRSFAVLLLLLMVPADGNEQDEILKYMCTPVGGSAFWNDIVQCCLPMDNFMQNALKKCLLLWHPYEIESTRRAVCANKNDWDKVMNCVHMRLIELQYKNDFRPEVNPNQMYTNCIEVLIDQMKHTKSDPSSGLPNYSRCLPVRQLIAAQYMYGES